MSQVMTLFVVDQALKAIMADEAVPDVVTGLPSYKGRRIEAVEAGMVLGLIQWTGDRGNWMWDGVLVTLRAMGVDTSRPLGAER